MKQWKNIAEALGVRLSDPERVSASLDSLEKVFRPLVGKIPYDGEPAPVMRPVERSGE